VSRPDITKIMEVALDTDEFREIRASGLQGGNKTSPLLCWPGLKLHKEARMVPDDVILGRVEIIVLTGIYFELVRMLTHGSTHKSLIPPFRRLRSQCWRTG